MTLVKKHKTPVVKDTQDPAWNHKAPFLIPGGDDKSVNLEVYDNKSGLSDLDQDIPVGRARFNNRRARDKFSR